jgi:adenosylhomocysteine nucleosidase
MNNIWCLFAMEEERMALFPDKTTDLIQEKPFTMRKDRTSGISILVTGIGTVNAAIATQHLLDRYEPDTIINLGTAGGVAPESELGKAYMVSEAIFFDVDVTAFGYSYGQIPRNGVETYQLHTLRKESCICASGDSFVTNFHKQYGPRINKKVLLVDMEIAGICHTLLVNNYQGKIYAIKGVSDKANHQATTSFKENMATALTQVHIMFQSLLAEIHS